MLPSICKNSFEKKCKKTNEDSPVETRLAPAWLWPLYLVFMMFDVIDLVIMFRLQIQLFLNFFLQQLGNDSDSLFLSTLNEVRVNAMLGGTLG